jgi:hypothetical protein
MAYKDVYKDIKNMLNKYRKETYWDIFGPENQFYIATTREALFSFTNDDMSSSFGIQLFYTSEGLNYLHDRLTTHYDGVVTIDDCDALFIKIVDKDNITDDERNYVKKQGCNIGAYNVIIYRYQPGYLQRYANLNELKIIYTYLEILASFIKNEFVDIVSAFDCNYTPMIFVEGYSYDCMYRPLPMLFRPYNSKPVNKQFVEEFKDKTYIDDTCYLYTMYSKTYINGENIKPLIIYIYYPNNNIVDIKSIIDKPSKYNESIFGVLYEIFEEHGMPLKLITNNLKLQSYFSNTLKKLNIEQEFKREEPKVNYDLLKFVEELDGMNDNIEEFLQGCRETSIEDYEEYNQEIEENQLIEEVDEDDTFVC